MGREGGREGGRDVPGGEVAGDEGDAGRRVDDTREGLEVLGTTDLELVGADGDAVEEEDIGGILWGTCLKEGKRLGFVYLDPDDRRSARGALSGGDHCLVEKLHEHELIAAHRNITHI